MRRSSSTWSCSTSGSREFVIDHLNASGDGVARHQRQVITIPFTIPGERVRAHVHRARDGTLAGTLEEVLQPSPHRITPRCPHFGDQPKGGCGGCTWQHIAYPEQLRLKSQLVTRLVREALARAPAALPTIPATPVEAPWGYRQKVHFVFGPGGRRAPLTMGHYARGSRRVIPVATCPVHDQRGNELAFRFHEECTRSGVTADSQTPLKGIAVRAAVNTPEIMATVVVAGEADRRTRAASRRVIESERPSSVHVNVHPRGDGYIFGRETRRIAGSDRLRDEVAGVSFLISPISFFQTNVRAAALLARLVLDAVPHPSRVLDLYAGSGLFALPLARAGDQVVAVEESHEAVADGEASRRLNNVDEERCRFIPRRVEHTLRTLRQPFDAVVLDPPRAGCSPEVIERLFAGIAPRLAMYVSCNPEALARDVRLIARFGYEVRSLQPVDMFPHTAHVETLAVLQKGAP
jgi:23S rRNA (uracil1939-C5)-methyltransferase